MPNSNTSQDQSSNKWLNHLAGLRSCLLKSLLAIGLCFAGLFYFANNLYTLLALPLIQHLPHHSGLIAIHITAPLLAPIKLTFVVAIVIAIPYILHQTWSFIAPGLYTHERRVAWPLVLSSTLLFYLGMVFSYFVVFPLIFKFFIQVAPKGIMIMPDINTYLDFCLKLFLAFGAAFEVPIITFILIRYKICTLESLKNKRPFIIVGAFIIGMLLTPPDVISQILLAIPIWLLFEVGIILGRLFSPHPST